MSGIAEKPLKGPGRVSSAFLQVRARSLDRSIPAARTRATGTYSRRIQMKSMKRVVLAAVAGTAIAVAGGVGIASAQTTPAPTTGTSTAPAGTATEAPDAPETGKTGPDTDNVQQEGQYGDQNAPDAASPGK
jgi:hypothetical protein